MLTGDFLLHSARRDPQRTAVIQDERRWSYAQLDRDADRFARALIHQGLGPGTRIALIARNIPEYAIAYFGAARAGVVSAHISARAHADEMSPMLDRIDARLVLFDSACAEPVAAALKHRHRVRAVKLDEASGPDYGMVSSSFQEFLSTAPSEAPTREIAASDPLAITFTGGTTGKPKAVVVSHAARHASAVTAITQFGWRSEDTIAVATPLFHAAGLFVCFAPAVLLGATTVLLRTWQPVKFIEAVERHRITCALLVPTQLNDLISLPECSQQRLASLREISYAGSTMSPNLLSRVRAALPHVRFTENYGQSETGPLTARTPDDPAASLTTVGRRVPGIEVEILRADGSAAPAGEIGEICTRGPHVFSGYLGDPDLTAQSFRDDGWLRTGDVGYFDADGFLTLVDRLRDIVISGGENIYPAEIENVLYQHPDVAECVAFGIPDDRSGELPAAHVVLRPDAGVAAETLIEFCANHIARHKRPRLIRFVAALPRTAVGKIQRNVVRSEYWKGRPRSI